MRALVVAGLMLLLVGGGIVFIDSDALSHRMPTQVVPRRHARIPLIAGSLFLVAAVGWFVYESF